MSAMICQLCGRSWQVESRISSVSVTSLGSSGDRSRALVRVACGRIAGFARAILEAHELGLAEGHHELPWTAEYHRDAVHVYAASLPASY